MSKWNPFFSGPDHGKTAHDAGIDRNDIRRALFKARANPGRKVPVKLTGIAQQSGLKVSVTVNKDGSVRVSDSEGKDVTYPPGGGPT